MERQARGYIYILHHSQDKLSEYIRERLNKKGYAVWKRDRDGAHLDEREAHFEAVQKALIIIVLETASLYKNKLGYEILLKADQRGKHIPRRICVAVEPDPGVVRQRFWRAHITFQKPARNDFLIKRLISGIELEKSVVSGISSKPAGYRGHYIFLSYSSKTSVLADEIRDRLTSIGMRVWDYGSSPRNNDLHYGNEIKLAIDNAHAVLIVLNAAWIQSDECQREHRLAVRGLRRRIWLKCGLVQPPNRYGTEEQIDLRVHTREQGYALLEKSLFPKRRKSKLT